MLINDCHCDGAFETLLLLPIISLNAILFRSLARGQYHLVRAIFYY